MHALASITNDLASLEWWRACPAADVHVARLFLAKCYIRWTWDSEFQACMHNQLPVSPQRHALVEYEQPEDAGRAVVELNDTGNWCGACFRSVHPLWETPCFLPHLAYPPRYGLKQCGHGPLSHA